MFKEDCFYFYAFHYSNPTDYTTEFHCDLYGELPFYYDCNNCPHYLNKNNLQIKKLNGGEQDEDQ